MRDGTTAVPLEEVAGKLKMVDPKCGLIKAGKTIGIRVLAMNKPK